MYFIPSSYSGQTPRYRVKVNKENGSYSYQIALPGYDKSDVKITCGKDSILRVSSVKTDIPSNYPIAEFSAKPFSLTWLVRGYEVSQAKMENGVLEILMGKAEIPESDTIPIS